MSESRWEAAAVSLLQAAATERIAGLRCKHCGHAYLALALERYEQIGRSEAELQRLREALRDIGNVIGGPTMGYEPSIERQELLKRVKRVFGLVEVALTSPSEPAKENL